MGHVRPLWPRPSAAALRRKPGSSDEPAHLLATWSLFAFGLLLSLVQLREGPGFGRWCGARRRPQVSACDGRRDARPPADTAQAWLRAGTIDGPPVPSSRANIGMRSFFAVFATTTRLPRWCSMAQSMACRSSPMSKDAGPKSSAALAPREREPSPRTPFVSHSCGNLIFSPILLQETAHRDLVDSTVVTAVAASSPVARHHTRECMSPSLLHAPSADTGCRRMLVGWRPPRSSQWRSLVNS
jgi:hypothetical protein